jgi:drug/metabolite transporter (DMT)-like permease
MENSDFLFLLLSSLMHAGWNFYAKRSPANKVVILWMGWMCAGFITLPFAIWTADFSQFGWHWIALLCLTVSIHAVYLYSLGSCYNVGEMSIIYPISRGIAIFMTVTIMLVFNLEEISSRGVLGVISLIIGIGFITIKRFRDLERRAIMINAAKVGVFVSLYSIVDKFSLQYIPAFLYISLMFTMTGLVLSPMMFFKLRSHALVVFNKHRSYSAMIGLVSFTTYYMVLLALDSAPASYVVALREISIVFGSILGMWLLKEEKSKRKIIGIIIITASVCIIKTA